MAARSFLVCTPPGTPVFLCALEPAGREHVLTDTEGECLQQGANTTWLGGHDVLLAAVAQATPGDRVLAAPTGTEDADVSASQHCKVAVEKRRALHGALFGTPLAVRTADDDRVVASLAYGEDALGVDDGVRCCCRQGQPGALRCGGSHRCAASDHELLAGARQPTVGADSEPAGHGAAGCGRHTDLRLRKIGQGCSL